jgi:hypothetical protein
MITARAAIVDIEIKIYAFPFATRKAGAQSSAVLVAFAMHHRICLRSVRQPQRSQRKAREANAEFLQRPASGYGLGHSFGQFIELVIHNFPFVFVDFCLAGLQTPNCDH